MLEEKTKELGYKVGGCRVTGQPAAPSLPNSAPESPLQQEELVLPRWKLVGEAQAAPPPPPLLPEGRPGSPHVPSGSGGCCVLQVTW